MLLLRHLTKTSPCVSFISQETNCSDFQQRAALRLSRLSGPTPTYRGSPKSRAGFQFILLGVRDETRVCACVCVGGVRASGRSGGAVEGQQSDGVQLWLYYMADLCRDSGSSTWALSTHSSMAARQHESATDSRGNYTETPPAKPTAEEHAKCLMIGTFTPRTLQHDDFSLGYRGKWTLTFSKNLEMCVFFPADDG